MKQKYIKLYFRIDLSVGIRLQAIYLSYENFKNYREEDLIEMVKQRLKGMGHKYVEFASRINDAELYIIN